jgi:ribosome-binding ATPase YchF (GTP1/OBG family)
MDIISLIVIFTVGFFLGKAHTYFRIAQILRDTLEEVVLDVSELKAEKEEEKTLVSKLEVETHGDMLYLFDRETDQFICQANSVQELAKLAKEYKQVVYAVVKYNDKVFTFQDGQSKEYPA